MLEIWNLIQLAKWMGVAPWDLAAQPAAWQEWGKACLTAELARDKATVERARRS